MHHCVNFHSLHICMHEYTDLEMTELETFNLLSSHMVHRLKQSGFYLGSAIEEIYLSLPDSSIEYRNGFYRCLATYDSIKQKREDDEYFDDLFTQLLAF